MLCYVGYGQFNMFFNRSDKSSTEPLELDRVLNKSLPVRHLCKRGKTAMTPTIHPQRRNLEPRTTVRTFRQQPQPMMITAIRHL